MRLAFLASSWDSLLRRNSRVGEEAGVSADEQWSINPQTSVGIADVTLKGLGPHLFKGLQQIHEISLIFAMH